MEKLICLIKNICLTASPTGFERAKAEFIKKWLRARGAKNTVIDDVGNVIFALGNANKPKVVFMAHIDTVFPLNTPLNFIEDDETLQCPSVGDNSANVAALMLAIEHLLENKVRFENYCLVFVFSTCEEGLGNLAGCRHFMETHNNIAEVIAVDGTCNHVNNNAVGSHRYKVTVRTLGGHSFHSFGSSNAIHIISNIVNDLYEIELPQKQNSKTTFNVGTIEGGTTVNSIAEKASILFEYRADDFTCLSEMKQRFDSIIEKHAASDCKIEVSLVGERPCAKNVNTTDLENLICKIETEAKKMLGEKPERQCGSMDCNIPLSMGIPSSSIGIYNGEGSHTEHELIYKQNLQSGLQMLINLILNYA